MANQKEPQRYAGVEWRVQIVALAMTIAFAILCLQFWRLQVVQLHTFKEMAEENRVWPKRLKSDRGIIHGRGDTVLADNRASADVVFVPGECPKEQREEVCRELERQIGVSAEALLERIHNNRGEPFTQIPVKRDIAKADRIRIQEHAYGLPGVYAVVHPQRRYLYGETAGQILGYLGEINQAELDARAGYSLGDLTGKGGLERTYEDLLHGRDGYTIVTKYAAGRPQLRTDRYGMPYVAPRDSIGNPLEEERNRRKEPVAGSPVYLTLDIALQAKCEELLRGHVGAIAVLEARTGAVLSLASSPGYDPSVFVDRGHSRQRLELLRAKPPNPMFNRAMRENYPPGSVFKVMLATAALEEGVITPESTFFCPGYYRLPNVKRRWHCHKRSGHGTVNVIEALAVSCDVFFYNVGNKLRIERISEWAHKMGLGQKTGIDLPGEIAGIIPSHEWKARQNADKPVWDQRWHPGDTLNVSIGQGSATTTPLQNAVMMACIVNGGYRIRPYLNRELGPRRSERICGEATWKKVVEGMRLCVEKRDVAPRGTGRRAYVEGVTLLGKTGSAQIMSLDHHEQYETEEEIPYGFRDHAWFVAGVLNLEPRIALCILIEHGHHGGEIASPLAKDIVEFFYGDQLKNERALLAQETAP